MLARHGITFREATPDDTPAMAALIAAAFTPEGEFLGMTPERVPGYPGFATAESLPRWAEKHAVTFFVLEDHGRMVACGGISPDEDDPRKAWLNRVSVDPSLQGQGYGQILVAHLEQVMRDRGCTRARLGRVTSNAGLERFYTRLGYEPVLTEMGPTWFVEITYMEKDL